jgi:hypothetical protein
MWKKMAAFAALGKSREQLDGFIVADIFSLGGFYKLVAFLLFVLF